jgi:hypothetical protein
MVKVEEIEIDHAELLNQLKDQIIKTGHYIHLDLYISEDEAISMPSVRTEIHSASLISIARYIRSLEAVISETKDEYPMVEGILPFFKAISTRVIDDEPSKK